MLDIEATRIIIKNKKDTVRKKEVKVDKLLMQTVPYCGIFPLHYIFQEKKLGCIVLISKMLEIDRWMSLIGFSEFQIVGFNFSWWLNLERYILTRIDRAFPKLYWT